MFEERRVSKILSLNLVVSSAIMNLPLLKTPLFWHSDEVVREREGRERGWEGWSERGGHT